MQLMGLGALIALVFTALGCASTPTRESTGQYIDDSAITTKAKFKLAKDDFLKSFDIEVETFKGVVQLSGFVDSQQMAQRAVELVSGIGGVRRVENSLIVKPDIRK